MVLAVLQRRFRLPLAGQDVYVSTVGGSRVVEPASDLAVTLAVVSSHLDRAPVRGLVAIGEVGLAGEIRPVAGASRRLAEAARLGFRRAVVPAATEELVVPEGMHVTRVADLPAAVQAAGLAQDDGREAHPSRFAAGDDDLPAGVSRLPSR
jgi:DNA repair protein RadA/Sms